MSPSVLIEALIADAAGAVRAEANGAHRLELCGGVHVGGTYPGMNELARVRRASKLPVMCMVRPRGGDFEYGTYEVDSMLHKIEAYRKARAAGVVFGVLKENKTWNVATMRRLLDVAEGLDVTAHRAFDETPDPFEALDMLVELGVPRVLTSGQAATAPEGSELLQQLVEHAAGRITILAGSGVTGDNYRALVEATGVKEVHGSWWARNVEA